MLQSDLVAQIAERPAQFAWFLGAGTSRSAGLPTATDIIWDLKRRFYRQEESRDVSPQDLQNQVVRDRIQTFLDSRGFPAQRADDEYPAYFEKIFGEDRERQRRYLRGMLSEEKVTLTIGHRALGAMLASGLNRAIFTTNFDSIIEKAVAEVSGRSLLAYSLEGTSSALNAILNEEYPFYCKLHGDFRFESLKNLPGDLMRQNEDLAKAFIAAATRFGLVVAGYSGRDQSVMKLMADALTAPNPFPHGLYWTGLKGYPVHSAVNQLINAAKTAGVAAEYVEIETFDALMNRLWKALDNRPLVLDAKVRKARRGAVNIPVPASGNVRPLIRLNALPIGLPARCLSLDLKALPDWKGLRHAVRDHRNDVVVTRAETVLAWGEAKDIRDCFGDSLREISEVDIPVDFQEDHNLYVKAFLEEALVLALSREKPLIPRMRPQEGVLIVDAHTDDVGPLQPLQQLVGKTSGKISGLFSEVTEEHPESQQLRWAEAVRATLDRKNGESWVLLEPDVWIWPAHARHLATDFLNERKGKRYNNVHNTLLNAWVQIILGTSERNVEVAIRPFGEGSEAENPLFNIGNRTGFTRKLLA